MKIFLDTASLKEIREGAALGVVDGITTNPSLLAKESGDPEESLRRHILSLEVLPELRRVAGGRTGATLGPGRIPPLRSG